MKIILSSFLILLFSSLIVGLDKDRLINQYYIEHWTIENGLPSNNINNIAQDQDGFIWIGTQDGVAKFNGKDFLVFNKLSHPTLQSNFIKSMNIDQSNNLWIGTLDSGVYLFKNNQFINYSSKNNVLADEISCIKETKDYILFGTIKGSNRIKKTKDYSNNDSFEIINDHKINDIFQDSFNDYWYATTEGLKRVSDKNNIHYTKEHGLLSNTITSICEKNGNDIYISSKDGGINIYNRVSNHISEYKQPYSHITTLFKDSNNDIWYGTNEGLTRMGEDNILILPHFITSIFEDKHNNLWIGTTNDGIYKLTSSKFIPYKSSEYQKNTVKCISKTNDGFLWIGTDKGIDIIDVNTNKYVSNYFPELKNKLVQSIFTDRNNVVWISSANNLYEINGNRLIKHTNNKGLNCNSINCIYKDSSDILWIGTDKGLFQKQEDKFVSFNQNHIFNDAFIHHLIEDNSKHLWISTNKGLYNYHNSELKQYNLSKTLNNNPILYVYQDFNGVLWISSLGNGLIKLYNNVNHFYSSIDGLLDDTIYNILEDNNGTLWFTTNKGIFCVKISDFEKYDNKELPTLPIKAYDTSDGLPSVNCNGNSQASAIKDSSDNLWFSTSKGVAKINPSTIKENSNPPAVYIEKLLVNNKPYNFENDISVDYDHNVYDIKYVALCYQNTNKIRYKYKLDGFNDDWIDAGDKRNVQYTNLDPGTYKFHVIACNNDFIWNKLGASLTIKVLPLYHQSYWFYGILIFGALLLFFGFIKFHKNKLKTSEDKINEFINEKRTDHLKGNDNKKQFLADISHDLRTPITIIKTYSQLIQLRNELSEKDKQYLNTINDGADLLSKIISELFEASKIEIGRIEKNESNVNLQMVIDNVYNYLLPFAQSKKLEFNIEINNDVPKVIITDKLKLEQILLNLIMNSIKFTFAGYVSLSVSLADNNILFRIKDTGIGIPKDKSSYIFEPFFKIKMAEKTKYDGIGLGLYIVESYIKLLDGKIWFESSEKIGSSFYFTLHNIVPEG